MCLVIKKQNKTPTFWKKLKSQNIKYYMIKKEKHGLTSMSFKSPQVVVNFCDAILYLKWNLKNKTIIFAT